MEAAWGSKFPEPPGTKALVPSARHWGRACAVDPREPPGVHPGPPCPLPASHPRQIKQPRWEVGESPGLRQAGQSYCLVVPERVW